MSSKGLCKLIRAAVIAIAICGLFACGYVIPSFGADLVKSSPEYSHYYFPWLAFAWMAAVPCFVFLLYIWKISTAIRCERVFTIQTAHLVRKSSVILFYDVGFFFAGNLLLLFLGISHLGILLISLIVDILGVSLSLFAAVLARYITKASALQEEVDNTI